MTELFENKHNDELIAAGQRLDEVRESIERAAKSVGRQTSSVSLIAVSKTQPTDAILPVIRAGHKLFGENRVQEAQGKWPELKIEYPDLELHLIGALQTNKVKDAVQLFDFIHTVDRPRLAGAIAREIQKQGKKPRLFIQVNTGDEPQKAGVRLSDVDKFLDQCRSEFKLNIEGLMCIPPIDEEPSLHFALLQKIAGRKGITGLSMGMSADYDVAIQFGATHIRVGTAIFGPRNSPPAT